MTDSFWLSAPPSGFTARCRREWATRMTFDKRFGQAAPSSWSVRSTEEYRLEAEDYRRQQQARERAA